MNVDRVIQFAMVLTLIFLMAYTCEKRKEDGAGGDLIEVPADSVPYLVYKDRPIPFGIRYVDSVPYHDTVWVAGGTEYRLQPVDTAAILRDYFATAQYSDTVKNDSSALIVINESINRNRVAEREVFFQNRRSTIIYQPHNNAIVLGVGGTLTGIDVSAGFRHKRNVLSVTYSDKGVGLRYQRELLVGK